MRDYYLPAYLFVLIYRNKLLKISDYLSTCPVVYNSNEIYILIVLKLR